MFDAQVVSELDRWGGLGVHTRRVPELDAWIFCALHDERRGTPTGGTRLKVYGRPAEGLIDALRLSRGMTQKWAALGLPFGGGKAVLCLARDLKKGERELLLRTYAHVLSTLAGSFGTGQDLGTTPADMRFLGGLCPSVHGIDPDTGEVEDPGPHTAFGVHTALKSALAQRFGDAAVAGRTILIEGLGDVGAPLARRLADEGAELLLVDLEPERARTLARELGARALEAGPHLARECDVYAPCAIGATLNAASIPTLGCRIVCGSANNQLLEPGDAERLHARGILYAPDFLANAGGAAYCSGLGTGAAHTELKARVLRIGTILGEVFVEAAQRDESPLHAAERRLER